jgi:hypothetical protein
MNMLTDKTNKLNDTKLSTIFDQFDQSIGLNESLTRLKNK